MYSTKNDLSNRNMAKASKTTTVWDVHIIRAEKNADPTSAIEPKIDCKFEHALPAEYVELASLFTYQSDEVCIEQGGTTVRLIEITHPLHVDYTSDPILARSHSGNIAVYLVWSLKNQAAYLMWSLPRKKDWRPTIFVSFETAIDILRNRSLIGQITDQSQIN